MRFRYLQSPEGSPFKPPDNPDLLQRAGFGPGRGYWTHSGFALINDGQLMLVMPGDDGRPERTVVAEDLARITVSRKPWWSLGLGLHLDIDGVFYTVEPEPLVPGMVASPARFRRARNAAKEFEATLAAAKMQG